MPRYSTPNRNRFATIRLLIIAGLALTAIGLFLLNERHFQHNLTTWPSITATAADTRIRPMAGNALEYGSTSLYEVDALATYTLNGTQHQDWLPISEPPHRQAVALAEANSLKGHTVTLTWDPATPDHKIATNP